MYWLCHPRTDRPTSGETSEDAVRRDNDPGSQVHHAPSSKGYRLSLNVPQATNLDDSTLPFQIPVCAEDPDYVYSYYIGTNRESRRDNNTEGSKRMVVFYSPRLRSYQTTFPLNASFVLRDSLGGATLSNKDDAYALALVDNEHIFVADTINGTIAVG